MEAIRILHSAEVRWFIKGSVPRDVLAWFLEEKRDDPKSRRDRYLILPGCESVGVKEREGRFEIKALQGTSEIVRCARNAVGRSETWAKWSYGKPAVDAWIEALRHEPEGWAEVEKVRRSRKFSLDAGTPEEVELDEQPREGCLVEMTGINSCGSAWWSVGLAAFGARERLRTNLLTVAEAFFSRHGLPLSLGIAESCSYPAWLNSFA